MNPKDSLQDWIRDIVKDLPENATPKGIAQYWYDHTDHTLTVKEMDLDLLAAILEKVIGLKESKSKGSHDEQPR